jgi:hypothetical protein
MCFLEGCKAAGAVNIGNTLILPDPVGPGFGENAVLLDRTPVMD